MIISLHPRSRHSRLIRAGWRDDRAAQLVEFAVALPLLVVFVVGIFDFSGAFTLRQKLTNVARDAARAGAADPASDLFQPSTSPPASVNDMFQMIDYFLKINHINDCGISVGSFAQSPPATWIYSSNGNGCLGSGITITINRAYYFPEGAVSPAPGGTCAATTTGNPAVIGTCVSIQYAYPWRFGRVASLLGGTAVLPSAITATAVAMNEN